MATSTVRTFFPTAGNAVPTPRPLEAEQRVRVRDAAAVSSGSDQTGPEPRGDVDLPVVRRRR
jgi:hypothetical protein